ncbi:phosphopantetheine-binding protein [Actinokineospora xionganensis]|uniref:Acyl carrier protein n=1 Tax=Actinokineospora xionganensis TaxID=2684470 RepID=A0ABR7L5E6_9PSEU|nr:phosphopantetheine-binding protein [Actinokineospora xionganensis]MBC6447896.1 acyl carrier protein [Actinokineospora xionganensis]
MSDMYDRLVDLLVTRFEVDRAEIKPGITFEDLEMDSLFLVELLLVVQSDLGVKLDEDSASPRDTIERAAELIAEQVNEAAAAGAS